MFSTQSRPQGTAPSGEARCLILAFHDAWKVWGILSRWVHAVEILLFNNCSADLLRFMIYDYDLWFFNICDNLMILESILSGNVTCFLSLLTGRVVASGCSCMQLCSQGPHLWPFISSQVKGLRDNDAHRQTPLVWEGSSWWSAVQEASSTGEIQHIV